MNSKRPRCFLELLHLKLHCPCRPLDFALNWSLTRYCFFYLRKWTQFEQLTILKANYNHTIFFVMKLSASDWNSLVHEGMHEGIREDFLMGIRLHIDKK